MDYIITPTYRGHFQFIEKYLKSFRKYVKDPENIEICFTISKDEKEDFKKIIAPYNKKINIKICIFEEILEKYNIPFNATELLERYGRFTFQTLKKFYTILYVNAKRSLVLDSESMWVDSVEMKKCFDAFFESPFITVSDINNRKWDEFTQIEISNIDYLLSQKCDVWTLENFMWFYDIDILCDLFNENGDLFQMAEKIYWKNRNLCIQPGIFEILLYQNYIYLNRKKYGYNVVRIDRDIVAAIGDEKYKEYKNKLYKKYGGACGIAEHMTELITSDTCEKLARLMRHNNQKIIRCDNSEQLCIYERQKKFLNILQPYILAASQGNFFGINQNARYISRKIIKKQYINVRDNVRRKREHMLWKFSIPYRTLIELHYNMSKIENTMNWRIDNLEKKIYASPNPISDYYMNSIFEFCEEIVKTNPLNWYEGKKILLVDCGYGELANILDRLGAILYLADRRSECCTISKRRVINADKSIVIRKINGKDCYLNEINEYAPFDLIIDLGMLFYNDLQNLTKWMNYATEIIFCVSCLKQIGEKIDGYPIDKDKKADLLDDVDGYSKNIISEFKENKWDLILNEEKNANYFNAPKILKICKAKK